MRLIAGQDRFLFRRTVTERVSRPFDATKADLQAVEFVLALNRRRRTRLPADNDHLGCRVLVPGRQIGERTADVVEVGQRVLAALDLHLAAATNRCTDQNQKLSHPGVVSRLAVADGRAVAHHDRVPCAIGAHVADDGTAWIAHSIGAAGNADAHTVVAGNGLSHVHGGAGAVVGNRLPSTPHARPYPQQRSSHSTTVTR